MENLRGAEKKDKQREQNFYHISTISIYKARVANFILFIQYFISVDAKTISVLPLTPCDSRFCYFKHETRQIHLTKLFPLLSFSIFSYTGKHHTIQHQKWLQSI